MRRVLASVAVALVGLLAIVAGVVFVTRSSTAEDFALEGVSNEELAGRDIVLKQPGADDQAAVDADAATEVAIGHASHEHQESAAGLLAAIAD